MVRPETKPDDVHGMIAAKGILTSRGGATSHAAVVARQFGTPAVCGAEELEISVEQRIFTVTIDDKVIEVHEGDWISMDGGTGEVFLGQLPTQDPDFENEVELNTLLKWADEVRTLGVWANADYPKDAERARRYGAEGVGLCRTEHMFFEEERLPIVQEMIMAHEQGAPSLPPWTACCRCSAATSKASSARWTASRSSSACWTRPCTSSCPPTRTWSRTWPTSRCACSTSTR